MSVALYKNVARSVPAAQAEDIADVCLIVEGAYPYVAGGVSAWVDGLIRRHASLRFCVVAILPEPPAPVSKYPAPPNLEALHHLYLSEFQGGRGRSRGGAPERKPLFDAVDTFLRNGSLADLAQINRLLAPLVKAGHAADLLNSPLAWSLVCDLYDRAMPHESFLHFFWAWRALFGGLVATLGFPLPKARIYHTVSTGYAGLLAARAAAETGRPAIVTEHGIYTNERRIEILQADWIVDTIDKGFSIHDGRRDLRDFWVAAFESYAKTCYQACAEVITLHEANQVAQKTLGAQAARMRIIPNGVDYKSLSRLPQAGPAQPATVALVGRVVPIKDIKTYLQAVHLLRAQFPDLRAWVLGPTDEQPDYHAVCRAMVAELDLAGIVEFTGKVDVTAYFPRMHVNVLTSLSESQPLSVLEAGAAGIPTVATNVGSCREILFGRRDEDPALGDGGILTDVAAPEQTAQAIAALLGDPDRRARLGAVMQERVKRYYDLDLVDQAYSTIYHRYRYTASRTGMGG
ncbi:MAG: polysaccharide biosynthesis protein PelF [Alphaproteobacteria bacterium]|nr:polysaccharide biosynthesis protein PelF [Alphaproteobacteria bacterium]